MFIYRSGESAGRCERTDIGRVSCLFIGLGRVLKGVRERIMLTCLAYLFVLRATERRKRTDINAVIYKFIGPGSARKPMSFFKDPDGLPFEIHE